MHLRRRWGVAIEGLETHEVRALRWMRFWQRSAAEAWVRRMNQMSADKGTLTRYVVIER